MLVASTAVSCGMSVECKNPYEKGKAEPQNRTADTKNLTEDAEDVMRFLRIDSAGENFWYSIDALSLDINKKDYSDVYEAFLTPIKNPAEKDRTCDFVEGRLRLDTAFFKTACTGHEAANGRPVTGVLGDDFRRIDVYIYPDIVRKDSLTYSMRGRTKAGPNICDFTGVAKIKNIYCTGNDDLGRELYIIIAEYTINEDASQTGSGKFNGIFGAYGYADDDNPGLIRVDDLYDMADGYENRTFVGVWRSHRKPETVKRCVWGDYRLPFTFDFDIGDGEMLVNPRYDSPEWDRIIYGSPDDIAGPESQYRRVVVREPWW